LEHTLVNVHHEEISLLFMERLNEEFDGKLSLAIQIFKNEYPKKFLHQLISGQLDMDRMDYLNRDSFFTGVHEGVIGYDRIIKMLAVHEGKLMVEEKGIYSIEKFLVARRLMYWQVYLHKTVLVAEQMLVKALQRAKELASKGTPLDVPASLHFFIYKDFTMEDFRNDRSLLEHFAKLDDFDIFMSLKNFMNAEDPLLRHLASRIVNRRLFKIEMGDEAFSEEYISQKKAALAKKTDWSKKELDYLVFEGVETNNAYSTSKDEIKILFKNGKVLPMSQLSDFGIQARLVKKYYLCHPKG